MLTTGTLYILSVFMVLIFLLLVGLVVQMVSFSAKVARLSEKLDEVRDAFFKESVRRSAPLSEKRLKYRAPSHFDGTIRVKDETYPIRIMDLSKTGAQIESSQVELAIDAEYEVTFVLSSGLEHVVRIRAVRLSSKEPRRYGALFKNLSVGTIREIADFVSHAASDEILG